MKVQFTKKPNGYKPRRATKGSSGYDLVSTETVTIKPGDSALIKTGVSVQIPHGYEGQVRPRSGLALKHGVTVLNAPGCIDADYRGEIGVILINHGRQFFRVCEGMRIAQLVFSKVEFAEFELVESLGETDRGDGGFGSTGEGVRR